MKKQHLKKISLYGLISGLCALQNLEAESPNGKLPSSSKSAEVKESDPNAGNMGYHLMSEEELLLELNDEGYKLYMSLDKEGRALAREVASARCNSANKCKGLNACKTDANECAGKGQCKGKSKCAMADKNLAVKLAAKKMAEKRGQVLQSSPIK